MESFLGYWLSAIGHSTSLRRVDVLFRLECPSNEADLLVRLGYYLDDIESEGDFWKLEQAQPFLRGANDSISLAPIDRLVWRSEHFVSAGLYFDEYQDFLVTIAAH